MIQDLDLSQNKLTLEQFEVWNACFWKNDFFLLAILGVETHCVNLALRNRQIHLMIFP